MGGSGGGGGCGGCLFTGNKTENEMLFPRL